MQNTIIIENLALSKILTNSGRNTFGTVPIILAKLNPTPEISVG